MTKHLPQADAEETLTALARAVSGHLSSFGHFCILGAVDDAGGAHYIKSASDFKCPQDAAWHMALAISAIDMMVKRVAEGLDVDTDEFYNDCLAKSEVLLRAEPSTERCITYDLPQEEPDADPLPFSRQ